MLDCWVLCKPVWKLFFREEDGVIPSEVVSLEKLLDAVPQNTWKSNYHSLEYWAIKLNKILVFSFYPSTHMCTELCELCVIIFVDIISCAQISLTGTESKCGTVMGLLSVETVKTRSVIVWQFFFFLFFLLLLSLTYIMSISNYLVKLFFGNLWLQKTPFILWHDSKYYLTQPAGVERGKTMVVGLLYYPGHTNHVCIVYDQLLQYNDS